MCDTLKRHGYSMFEISDMMPWHLDLMTEMLKRRIASQSNNPHPQ